MLTFEQNKDGHPPLKHEDLFDHQDQAQGYGTGDEPHDNRSNQLVPYQSNETALVRLFMLHHDFIHTPTSARDLFFICVQP